MVYEIFMLKKIVIISSLFLFIWMGCHQSTEQVPSAGHIQGTVKRLLSGVDSPLSRAFILWGDSLLATTDSQGSYRIDNLDVGNYALTGSALFCEDTILSVLVQGGRTITLDFMLNPDSATGMVLGEFQDGWLWEKRLLEDTSLVNWSEKEICDAATGATLQYKTLKDSFPDFIPYCYVFLADSSLILADAWGQYGIVMQQGTYPLTGSCEGYKSVTHVIQVNPDERTYVNFILPRVATAKYASK
jgi:hypothetical protein